MPLKDLFAAPGLLETNDNWEGVATNGGLAYFNKNAAMDLWVFKLLYKGNSIGPSVGLSYGFCTVLPGVVVF